jgi:hypothetical protein
MNKDDLYLWAVVAWDNHYPEVWNIRKVFRTEDEANAYVPLLKKNGGDHIFMYQNVEVQNLASMVIDGMPPE